MKIKIITIMLILSASVYGQVNIEKMRLGLTEPGIAGSIDLSYKIVRGNSEFTEIGLGPNLIWRTGRHQMFILNNLSRVSSNGGSIINKGFSHFRYNYDFTKKYIYELFIQAQYDRSRHLEHRYLAGSGIRVIAVNSENFKMANGITGMYEYEELSSGDISRLVRGSFYMTLNFSNADSISFTNTIYIQPSTENINDYRILNEGQFKVKITGYFALTTTIQYRYDSRPPIDIKHYDLGIKNGLEFGF
ncbi:MAG: DUF481 domain-containing protein [candidate division Zixibacteria bacterium]|nr:DUF481 domain-containing protein [candidate division Zixibacteria bacterium]